MTTWTQGLKPAIINSFLLMEDGGFLLQENGGKIILHRGWTDNSKHDGLFSKSGKSVVSWVKQAK